jgi:aminomethyltransferase
LLSRTGYTGEVGYEWYLPAGEAQWSWEQLLKAGEGDQVKPAGLGARDLLRLDVGYLLYGNDMDEQTTPLEAGVEWVVAWNKGPFQGHPTLQQQKEKGVTRKLVGFELMERGVPRHDMAILVDGKTVGKVTSGNFSPILQKGIGLGSLPPDLCQEGITLEIDIRGKRVSVKVVKLPFYKRQKS